MQPVAGEYLALPYSGVHSSFALMGIGHDYDRCGRVGHYSSGDNSPSLGQFVFVGFCSS